MNTFSAMQPDIPGYSILGVIGSGGMGTVYSGVDAEGRKVAIKVLHPGLAADEEVRARLRREASTLHRVKGAQVAQVLDAELDAPQAFIVTELIEGQDLAESVAQHGPLDDIELADLAAGLASALSSIHAAGVVHRDLKPGNVMLTDDGPVLIDFGISQILDDTRLTRTGLVTGTPGYVDPLVLAGADPDELGDWWGWAALLVFAGTGRPPFGPGPLTAVLTRAEAGRADVEGLPDPTATALTRALSPRPETRIAPSQVIEVLSAVARREPVDLQPLVPQHPLPPVYPPAGLPPTAAMPAHQGPPPPTNQPHDRQEVVAAWPQVPAPPSPAFTGPPRPRRLTTFGVWLAFIAVGFTWPGVAVVLFGVGALLTGMLGSAGQELRKRRSWYGRRRRDIALLLLTSPVHLLLAALRSTLGLLLGAVLGAFAWYLVGQVDEFYAAPAAIAVALFVFWWTPTSVFTREGTRLVVGVGGQYATIVWLLLAGIVIVAALVLIDGTVTWAPLPEPPAVRFFGVS